MDEFSLGFVHNYLLGCFAINCVAWHITSGQIISVALVNPTANDLV